MVAAVVLILIGIVIVVLGASALTWGRRGRRLAAGRALRVRVSGADLQQDDGWIDFEEVHKCVGEKENGGTRRRHPS